MILHPVKNRSEDAHIFPLGWFPNCVAQWTGKESSGRKHPDTASSSQHEVRITWFGKKIFDKKRNWRRVKLRMVFSGPWERERDQETIFKSDALHLRGLWPPACPKMGWHVGNFLSWSHVWRHHYCKGNSTGILPSVLPPSLRRAAVGRAGPCPALDLLLRGCLWSTCPGPCTNWEPPCMCTEAPCWGESPEEQVIPERLAPSPQHGVFPAYIHLREMCSVCMSVERPEEILFSSGFAFGKRSWH